MVIGVVLMTVITILFTRLMGAEEYGRLAFLLSGSFILVLFAGLGLPTASVRVLEAAGVVPGTRGARRRAPP